MTGNAASQSSREVEHLPEDAASASSAIALHAWLFNNLRSDLIEHPWLASALRSPGLPSANIHLSMAGAGSSQRSYSELAVTMLADSLASTAATVTSRTFLQSGQPFQGSLGAGPEFSWQSSYCRSRNSGLPGAWPATFGSPPPSSTHCDSSPAYGCFHMGAQGFGPMRKTDVMFTQTVPQSQAQSAALSMRGCRERYGPYQRLDAAPIRRDVSLSEAQCTARRSAPDIWVFQEASSSYAERSLPRDRRGKESECDDSSLTLGPGKPCASRPPVR